MSRFRMLAAATLIAGALWPAALEAQEGRPATTVVYLVRHAETAPDGSRDPALSAAGLQRAERLARMLAGAGLTAVHTTPYRRTRATAGPVAWAIGVTPSEYDPSDLVAFAATLRASGGRHLVVGHSNTTPALVRLLGGDAAGPIAEDDHGRVYQLTLGPAGTHTALLGYPGGFLAEPPPTSPGAMGARLEDVRSVDGIVAALYDAISGPAGQPRDWDRLRGLFLPTARMIPVQRRPDGEVVHRVLTVDEYIQSSGPMLVEIGFRERELARQVERFGEVAHVFSTYEGRREGVAGPLVRGVNTIQLIHDGARWWVASIAWSPERPDLPLPPEYLP